MKWNPKRGFLAALAVIAATNAIALIGAAYNRSGEPESVVRLTERELQLGHYYRNRENSGVDLQVRWRAAGTEGPYDYGYGSRYGGNIAWLDKAKMAELGFDVSVPHSVADTGRTFDRQLGRDVLVVLEMDGPAYQQTLLAARSAAEKVRPKAPKEADELLERELNSNSRLFAIDAGLDAAALRLKYPDRSKYIVAGGRVAPSRNASSTTRTHAGYISDLHIETINVPLEHRRIFEGVTPGLQPGGNSSTPYYVTVSFGKRLEPWMVDAQRNLSRK